MTAEAGTTSRAGILLAVGLGSGMVFLDGTVVNVALPSIGEELPSSLLGTLEAQSYVYNAYLLALSALLVLAGALNDHYGRRRMFLLGLIGFTVTSMICGLAPTMEWLIAARVLQGAAGALLVPGSLSIITASFPEGEARGRAFGIWASATTMVMILGPLVGGLLVDTISWRAAFFINLPIGALALWATIRFVPESRDQTSSGRFDWLGAVVIAVAIGGLVFGAIRGQERQWEDPVAWVALAVGTAAAIAFPFLMRRSPNPLVPLELFKSRNFTVTNISTLLIYGGLYVVGYFTAIFLQGTLGYTASAAGLAAIPASLLLGLFAERFGVYAGRYGPRRFMAAGPALMALGVAWFARIPADSAPWLLVPGEPSAWVPPLDYLVDILPGQILLGLGLMMMVAPLTTALMGSVPVENSGTASAVNNAVSRVGPQLAGAAIFVVATAVFYGLLGTTVPSLDVDDPAVRAQTAPLNQPDPSLPAEVRVAAEEASTSAFHVGMWVAAGLMAAGAAVNWIWIRDPVRPRSASEDVTGCHPTVTPVLVRDQEI